jgi:predicted RNase H-like HicB family nuclease
MTGTSNRPLSTGQEDLRLTLASRPYNCTMGFDDYKVVLYRQDDGSWVAEIPALGGCHALMDTREEALAELQHVFDLIAQEHQDRGQALPKDTTEIVRA